MGGDQGATDGQQSQGQTLAQTESEEMSEERAISLTPEESDDRSMQHHIGTQCTERDHRYDGFNLVFADNGNHQRERSDQV